MPHLVQMGRDYESRGLQVLGITEAPASAVTEFMDEHELTFPVFADAASTKLAYGIDLIWGSPVFLLNAAGFVVAEELSNVEDYLAELAPAAPESAAQEPAEGR